MSATPSASAQRSLGPFDPLPRQDTDEFPGLISMELLVVGDGGREHALAWKLASSEGIERVYVAPGNPGTAGERGVENIAIAADDLDALVEFAVRHRIGLVVVGPEAPLVAGLADALAHEDVPCFGPSAAAARLEGSKSFAKSFLERHGIPTARFETFDRLEPAADYVRARGAPIVIKADGLAGGKGVTVARTLDEAVEALEGSLRDGAFGSAGERVVVEDFLEGEEASFICMVDHERIVPLASAQDYKTRDDDDAGPNTGGMGAHSPAPALTSALHRQVMRDIVNPTARAMVADGAPFTGFLYAGLMIGRDGTARVLEFNVRCGDPETQPIMLRLRSDLAALCGAAAAGGLEAGAAEWDPRSALGVVLAAEGYPGAARRGDPITGLDDHLPETRVFHAGTALDAEGRVVTAGGRVLCVCGMGDDIGAARERAYARADRIDWPGRFCRTDIGRRLLMT